MACILESVWNVPTYIPLDTNEMNNPNINEMIDFDTGVVYLTLKQRILQHFLGSLFFFII